MLEPAAPIQDSVALLEVGRSRGAIFPATFELGFNREQLRRRFTPSPALIREIEPDVQRQFWEASIRFTRNQVWGRDDEVYGEGQAPTEEERLTRFASFVTVANWEASRYARLDRQYAGFYNPRGERVVLIQFLDFCADPHQLRPHLAAAWIGGWHGWFETNVRLLEYNVERNRLNAFGWGQL